MKRIVFCIIWTVFSIAAALAAEIKDTVVVTQHEVTVDGQRISYTAKTGIQSVLNEKGKPVASVFFVYYERNGITDKAKRPIIFSFNGGPGSAAVWMQIGFTGPQILNLDDEGYPVQPYGLKENPNTILDVADIVYICPVSTGFSRVTDDKINAAAEFYGVNSDIKYLGEWINRFVYKHDRWLSPKYLIGESYGTTRVSGLALELQKKHWMYLNGVVLVSAGGLELNTSPFVRNAFSLPQYTATAWYHKVLPPDLQSKDLSDILPEVESFAINDYTHALILGGALPPQERSQIAAKVARYSGISEKVVLENNLVIPPNFFRKELLRDKGFTVGRLDSRYLGMDKDGAGIESDYEPSLESWLHSFAPPINAYLRNDLKYSPDLSYYLFGPIHGGPWDKTDNHVGDDLRMAMNENPGLHLMVMEGYYDTGAYFNAKYMTWQLDITGRLKDRIEFHEFRCGHMIYLRKADLKTAIGDLKAFIKKSTPEEGKAIKYTLSSNE